MKSRKVQREKGLVRIRIGTSLLSLSPVQMEEEMARLSRGEPAAGQRLFLSLLPPICAELRAAGLRGRGLLEAIRRLQEEFLSVLRNSKDIFPGKVRIEVVRKSHRSATRVISGKLPSRGRERRQNYIFFLMRLRKRSEGQRKSLPGGEIISY